MNDETNGYDDLCKSGKVSNCCGADMYCDSDICPDCLEHCEPINPDEEDEDEVL